jgi:protoporphyrinogen oxidase
MDAVWSTLPISLLVRLMDPPPPQEVLDAANAISFRGMILIYLALDTPQFTEYDAHYFPELDVPISRMSEPKNYSAVNEPADRTVLCAELPADPGDEYWACSDDELGRLYCEWLERVGLPVRARVLNVTTRRLKHAYPVYDRNYEKHLRVMDEWISGVEGLLTFGRQGLFAHDNTHHALAMALAASHCLDRAGRFDLALWAKHRETFESHVVED